MTSPYNTLTCFPLGRATTIRQKSFITLTQITFYAYFFRQIQCIGAQQIQTYYKESYKGYNEVHFLFREPPNKPWLS
ncbi:MAG: hypothetical protein PVJ72_09250, partial [Gammaproteobacteria bacterium]